MKVFNAKEVKIKCPQTGEWIPLKTGLAFLSDYKTESGEKIEPLNIDYNVSFTLNELNDNGKAFRTLSRIAYGRFWRIKMLFWKILITCKHD
jgi:hypothetical protein